MIFKPLEIICWSRQIRTTTIPDVHGSRFAASPVALRIFPPPRPRKSPRLPSARPRLPPGSILHPTNPPPTKNPQKQNPTTPPTLSKNPSKMSAVVSHHNQNTPPRHVIHNLRGNNTY